MFQFMRLFFKFVARFPHYVLERNRQTEREVGQTDRNIITIVIIIIIFFVIVPRVAAAVVAIATCLLYVVIVVIAG